MVSDKYLPTYVFTKSPNYISELISIIISSVNLLFGIAFDSHHFNVNIHVYVGSNIIIT